MSVRIRMKKMGRAHRPFFRVCVMDQRAPRDGRVIEEVGTYDPMVPETDARVTLKGDRIDHWLGVGAQPSEKVAVLIAKYGSAGSHLEAQKAAVERLGRRKAYTPPAYVAPPVKAAPEPVAVAEPEAVAEAAPEATAEGTTTE